MRQQSPSGTLSGKILRPGKVVYSLYSMKVLALATLIIFAGSAQSAEIDSVTPRTVALEDGVDMLNKITNSRLQEGVEQANEKQLDDIEATEPAAFCDEELLYDSLRKAIFQSRSSAVSSLKGYALDKQLRVMLDRFAYALPLELSIMKDWTYPDGYSVKLKGLSSIMNTSGHLIGIDKLGHFFAEGWSYFDRAYLDGEGIGEAMAWGAEKERGSFGYTTTGIFSYADLVANFGGMRFWNRILLKNPDPLRDSSETAFNKAYVKCEFKFIKTIAYLHQHRWNFKKFKLIKAWQIKRRFDLRDYLDGTWDEGVNCNAYASTDLEEKIANRIQQVDPGFKCPVKPLACLAAQDKYGRYAKKLLHPSCLGYSD